MGFSVFQIFIASIATIALIFLFLNQFSDLFGLNASLEQNIKEQLTSAELQLGQSISKETTLNASQMNASVLDTRDRSVAFACTSEKDCCPKGTQCTNAINWDERNITIQQKRIAQVTARCTYDDLYICKTYFGKKPGQVSLTVQEGPKTYLDLVFQPKQTVQFQLKNTGELHSIQIKPELELVRVSDTGKTSVGMQVLRRTLEDENAPWYDLQPGETVELTGSIQVETAGNYELVIRATETNDLTNFIERKIAFTATGTTTPSACRYDSVLSKSEVSPGQCETHYGCQDCTFAFECLEKVQNEVGGPFVQEESPEYAIAVEPC